MAVIDSSELRRIARAISAVENHAQEGEQILAQAYRRQPWPEVIGITGLSGSGKSTLVDALSACWAQTGERIAVLAIDPSSPYSGGAVLGDRVRRTRATGYDNIYFRSLASRGHAGGLSETATDLVAVLGLFEFRRIIIETVGAGQADIDIHATADATVVMTVPGLGDGVQASKAGLMEIGDVFAVNKADMPGAREAARMIERALAAVYAGEPGVNSTREMTVSAARYPATAGLAALRLRHGDVDRDETIWCPPVLELVATENQGVTELARAVDAFITWSDDTGRGRQRRQERAYGQVLRALSALLLEPYMRVPGSPQPPALVAPWIERIADGKATPLEAARALLTKADR